MKENTKKKSRKKEREKKLKQFSYRFEFPLCGRFFYAK